MTLLEVRRLLHGVVLQVVQTAAQILHWSNWRRHHQALAKRCHFQRRLARLAAFPV